MALVENRIVSPEFQDSLVTAQYVTGGSFLFEMKKYQIIYADPPWSYYNDTTLESPKLVKEGGMRYPPYPVMASAEIKRLPVSSIAADDSVLFIWTTDYHLARCVQVIEAWGFQYKTIGFAWQKTNKAGQPVCFMGAYTMKSGIELCLLATRGKNAHKMIAKYGVKGRLESQRGAHSKKPDEVRDRIVDLFGDRPRIELFAREKHRGWDAWGNEIDNNTDFETVQGDLSQDRPESTVNVAEGGAVAYLLGFDPTTSQGSLETASTQKIAVE